MTGSTKTAVLEAMTELRGKSWAVYSAVGCQSTLHAGAVSPHCLLPLGYEHYGARFPGLRR
ncbi:MAG TPA: hypothetical protein VN961_15470, partial [Streptosporangiaceae bacterium]|nr:hypothetical protein [Streptosporangiaceae bacterium]